MTEHTVPSGSEMPADQPGSDPAPRPLLLDSAVAPGLMLALFSLVATLLLSVTDELTSSAIAARKAEDLRVSLAQVLPSDLTVNDPAETLRTLRDPIEGDLSVYLAQVEGEVTAVAFALEGVGYSGTIRTLLGVSADGTLLGARVLSHTETPGLGDKIEAAKSDWIHGFSGLSLQDPETEGWEIQRDGGVFDQFSGASITPRTVVRTVRRGLELAERNQAELFAPAQLAESE